MVSLLPPFIVWCLLNSGSFLCLPAVLIVCAFQLTEMKRQYWIFSVLVLSTPCCVGNDAESAQRFSAEKIEFFESRVRPILARHCYECHGKQKQESGLRLDSRSAILAGGDSGETVVMAGDPAKGLLVRALRHDGDLKMPPEERLSAKEIADVVSWITMGLPWPQEDDKVGESLSLGERIQRDRREHWAFQPVRRPVCPDLRGGSSPIDRFVLARLHQAGLTPSPATDRYTLVRRATFDLLGLPPEPDEVEVFARAAAPDAYERLIDRLLASPRYGERWGRHWLDVARYADTRGYAFGRERRFPYAYTYRDYVIDALNSDKPYNEFIVEQLAADRLSLPERDPRLAALGFLTVGRKFNNEHDDIDDQIDVVMRGLMGLTVACARCHDHKYDAIPTEDYYSLYGVLASSHEPGELPLVGNPADTPGFDEFQKELDNLQKNLDDFEAKKYASMLDTARSRVTDYLVRVVSKQPEHLLQKLPFISLSAEELKPQLVQRWRAFLQREAKADHPVFGPWRELVGLPKNEFTNRSAEIVNRWRDVPRDKLNPLVKQSLESESLQSNVDVARLYGRVFEEVYKAWKDVGDNQDSVPKLTPPQQQIAHLLFDESAPAAIPRRDLHAYFNREDRNQRAELQKKIDTHQVQSAGAPPRAMVLFDKPSPFNPQVFIRGNHARRGKQVPRQFVALLSGDARKPFANGSGRKELANAIVSPDNPLTSRVIVNRVWMHHFGEPLVDTPSDFGIRSDSPSHLQLLDWLAADLMSPVDINLQSSWSLKQLHRTIMLSRIYQQASIDRPDCRAIDPENRLLWRMNRRRLEFEPLRDSLLAVSGVLDLQRGGKPVDIFQPSSHRRSIYGLIDRQDLPQLLRDFDLASPDQSAERRTRTTVPQQALFMMNSPFVIEQAKAFLQQQEVATTSDSTERIHALHRIVFGRAPKKEEVAIGVEFIRIAISGEEIKLNPWEQYVQLLLLTNEFMFLD